MSQRYHLSQVNYCSLTHPSKLQAYSRVPCKMPPSGNPIDENCFVQWSFITLIRHALALSTDHENCIAKINLISHSRNLPNPESCLMTSNNVKVWAFRYVWLIHSQAFPRDYPFYHYYYNIIQVQYPDCATHYTRWCPKVFISCIANGTRSKILN